MIEYERDVELAGGDTPDQEMWVYRFQRDGEPREIHHRRHEQTEPRTFAKLLANEVGGPVMWTAARITANYVWRWLYDPQDPFSAVLWQVAFPKGDLRTRRVEDCPNGCGRAR